MAMDIFENNQGFIEFREDESKKVRNIFTIPQTKRKPCIGVGFSKYYDKGGVNLIKQDIAYYLINNGVQTYFSSVVRKGETVEVSIDKIPYLGNDSFIINPSELNQGVKK